MIVTEFFAKLGMQVDRGSFNRAEQQINDIGGKFRALAAGLASVFAGNAIAQFAIRTVAAADDLGDAADKLRVSTDELQQLGHAAQLSGSSIEQLQAALGILGRTQANAAKGNKAAAASFKLAGLDIKEGNPAELLGQLADKLEATEDPIERSSIVIGLLGRQAAGLVPLLSKGSEGINALRKDAIELGGGFSKEFVEAASKAQDQLDRLSFAAIGVKGAFVSGMLPVLTRVVNALIAGAKALQSFIKGTHIIEVAVAVVTAAFVAWGLAMVFAHGKLLLTLLPVAVLIVLLEDIFKLLTGGKSAIGDWLDAWGGIGTADKLTRNWSAGLKILRTDIDSVGRALLDIGNITPAGWLVNLLRGDLGAVADSFKRLRGTASDLSDASDRQEEEAGKQAYLQRTQDEINAMPAGAEKDSRLEWLERTRRAWESPTRLGGSEAVRALGRATDAPIEDIVGGRASASAAAESRAAFGMTTPSVDASTHVNVNVAGISDPKKIAAEMKRAAREANREQVKQVRAAIAPKAARKAGAIGGEP